MSSIFLAKKEREKEVAEWGNSSVQVVVFKIIVGVVISSIRNSWENGSTKGNIVVTLLVFFYSCKKQKKKTTTKDRVFKLLVWLLLGLSSALLSSLCKNPEAPLASKSRVIFFFQYNCVDFSKLCLKYYSFWET